MIVTDRVDDNSSIAENSHWLFDSRLSEERDTVAYLKWNDLF